MKVGDKVLIHALKAGSGDVPVGFLAAEVHGDHLSSSHFWNLRCAVQPFRRGSMEPVRLSDCLFEIDSSCDPQEVHRQGTGDSARYGRGPANSRKEVLFGQSIQLKHVMSGKHLCINVYERSLGEDLSMQVSLKRLPKQKAGGPSSMSSRGLGRSLSRVRGSVDLDAGGAEGSRKGEQEYILDSWFELRSPVSYGQPTDVRENDDVHLYSARWHRYLHIYKNEEINASLEKSHFRLVLFTPPSEKSEHSLFTCGDFLRICHLQSGAFLHGEAEEDVRFLSYHNHRDLYHRRLSEARGDRKPVGTVEVVAIADAVQERREIRVNSSSFALWQIEPEHVVHGGLRLDALVGRCVRLRHVVSGGLLAVQDDGGRVTLWFPEDEEWDDEEAEEGLQEAARMYQEHIARQPSVPSPFNQERSLGDSSADPSLFQVFMRYERQKSSATGDGAKSTSGLEDPSFADSSLSRTGIASRGRGGSRSHKGNDRSYQEATEELKSIFLLRNVKSGNWLGVNMSSIDERPMEDLTAGIHYRLASQKVQYSTDYLSAVKVSPDEVIRLEHISCASFNLRVAVVRLLHGMRTAAKAADSDGGGSSTLPSPAKLPSSARKKAFVAKGHAETFNLDDKTARPLRDRRHGMAWQTALGTLTSDAVNPILVIIHHLVCILDRADKQAQRENAQQLGSTFRDASIASSSLDDLINDQLQATRHVQKLIREHHIMRTLLDFINETISFDEIPESGDSSEAAKATEELATRESWRLFDETSTESQLPPRQRQSIHIPMRVPVRFVLDDPSTRGDVADNMRFLLKAITTLGCSFVRNYPKCQVSLMPYVPLLRNLLSYGLAGGMLEAAYNYNVQSRSTNIQDDIAEVIHLLDHRGYNARFVDILRALCEATYHNQIFITETVDREKTWLIPSLRLDIKPNGVISALMVKFKKGDTDQEVRFSVERQHKSFFSGEYEGDFVQRAPSLSHLPFVASQSQLHSADFNDTSHRKSFAEIFPERMEVDSSQVTHFRYLVSCVRLLASMCRQGYQRAHDIVESLEGFSLDIVFQVASSKEVPTPLRSAYCELLVHLYLERSYTHHIPIKNRVRVINTSDVIMETQQRSMAVSGRKEREREFDFAELNAWHSFDDTVETAPAGTAKRQTRPRLVLARQQLLQRTREFAFSYLERRISSRGPTKPRSRNVREEEGFDMHDEGELDYRVLVICEHLLRFHAIRDMKTVRLLFSLLVGLLEQLPDLQASEDDDEHVYEEMGLRPEGDMPLPSPNINQGTLQWQRFRDSLEEANEKSKHLEMLIRRRTVKLLHLVLDTRIDHEISAIIYYTHALQDAEKVLNAERDESGDDGAAAAAEEHRQLAPDYTVDMLTASAASPDGVSSERAELKTDDAHQPGNQMGSTRRHRERARAILRKRLSSMIEREELPEDWHADLQSTDNTNLEAAAAFTPEALWEKVSEDTRLDSGDDPRGNPVNRFRDILTAMTSSRDRQMRRGAFELQLRLYGYFHQLRSEIERVDLLYTDSTEHHYAMVKAKKVLSTVLKQRIYTNVQRVDMESMATDMIFASEAPSLDVSGRTRELSSPSNQEKGGRNALVECLQKLHTNEFLDVDETQRRRSVKIMLSLDIDRILLKLLATFRPTSPTELLSATHQQEVHHIFQIIKELLAIGDEEFTMVLFRKLPLILSFLPSLGESCFKVVETIFGGTLELRGAITEELVESLVHVLVATYSSGQLLVSVYCVRVLRCFILSRGGDGSDKAHQSNQNTVLIQLLRRMNPLDCLKMPSRPSPAGADEAKEETSSSIAGRVFQRALSISTAEEDLEPARDDEVRRLFKASLVELLEACSHGGNHFTEVQCRSLLSIDALEVMILDEEEGYRMRIALARFLNAIYFDVQVPVAGLDDCSEVWRLMRHCEIMFTDLCQQESPDREQKEYVVSGLAPVMINFFKVSYSFGGATSGKEAHAWQVLTAFRLLKRSCEVLGTAGLLDNAWEREAISTLACEIYHSDAQIQGAVERMEGSWGEYDDDRVHMGDDSSAPSRDLSRMSTMLERTSLDDVAEKALRKRPAVNFAQILRSALGAAKTSKMWRTSPLPIDVQISQRQKRHSRQSISIPLAALQPVKNLIRQLEAQQYDAHERLTMTFQTQENDEMLRSLIRDLSDIDATVCKESRERLDCVNQQLNLLCLVIETAPPASVDGKTIGAEAHRDALMPTLGKAPRSLDGVRRASSGGSNGFFQSDSVLSTQTQSSTRNLGLIRFNMSDEPGKLGDGDILDCRQQQSRIARYGGATMIIQLMSLPDLPESVITAAYRLGNALLINGHSEVQDIIYDALSNSRYDEKLFSELVGLFHKSIRFIHERKHKKVAGDLFALTRDPAGARRPSTAGDSPARPAADLEKRPKRRSAALELQRTHLNEVSGMYSTSHEFMISVLNFISKMCANHNKQIQDYLREQPDNIRSYNVVSELVGYLAEIEWVLDLYSNSNMWNLNHQTIRLAGNVLSSLSEVVQGNMENTRTIARPNLIYCLNDLLEQRYTDPFWREVVMDEEEGKVLVATMRGTLSPAELKASGIRLIYSILGGSHDSEVYGTVVANLNMEAVADYLTVCEESFIVNWLYHRRMLDGVRIRSTDGFVKSSSWEDCKNLSARVRLANDVRTSVTWLDQAVSGEAEFLRFRKEEASWLQRLSTLYKVLKLLVDAFDMYELAELLDAKSQRIFVRTFLPFIKRWDSRHGRVELVREGKLERIYFGIPESCLRASGNRSVVESRKKIKFKISSQSDNASERIQRFMAYSEQLLDEMDYVSRLQRSSVNWLTAHELELMNSTFVLAIAINVLDFGQGSPGSTAGTLHFEHIFLVSVVLGLVHLLLSVLRLLAYAYNRGMQTVNEFVNSVDSSKLDSSAAAKERTEDVRERLGSQGGQSFRDWCADCFSRRVVKCSFGRKSFGAWKRSFVESVRRRVQCADDYSDGVTSWDRTKARAWRLLILLSNSKYNVFYLVISIVGNALAIPGPDWIPLRSAVFTFNLLDVAFREKAIESVLGAVVLNRRALLQTALLAMVVMFIYGSMAFALFADDFNVDGPNTGCESLFECVLTIFNYGLRIDAGISDVMDHFAFTESAHGVGRFFFDISYWISVTLLLLNLFAGVILDSFGKLRDETQRTRHVMESRCFICGVESGVFDQHANGFDAHVSDDHNMWSYAMLRHYLVHHSNPAKLTGQERYLLECYKHANYSFLPSGQALCLEKVARKDIERAAARNR